MENKIGSVILVLSGKGGVGKSTVAAQIALTLLNSGFKVGLLDVDICGPSIPHMLGLGGHEVQADSGGSWLPVPYRPNLLVMSIAFLLKNNKDAVIWRGPKKHAMIKQFVSDVNWGELDYLIVDTPPGTSDEHISIVEIFKQQNTKLAAVLVTTPNLVAISDVRREVTFCNKTGLNVIGIIENMTAFVCPHCKDCSEVFPSGGGSLLSDETGLPLLGRIPMDPALLQCTEKGQNFMLQFANSPVATQFNSIVQSILSYQKPVMMES